MIKDLNELKKVINIFKHKRLSEAKRNELKNNIDDYLTTLFINYVSGGYIDFDKISDLLKLHKNSLFSLFANFGTEWEALPCDAEGFTKEQEKEADNLINQYVSDFLELTKNIDKIKHQKTLKNEHKQNMLKIAENIEELRNRKIFDCGKIAFCCRQYENEYKLYCQCVNSLKILEA